jgi:hypothetical protein
MTTVNALIAEIKADLESYDSAGLIDDISMMRWALTALRKFGANVTTLQDTMVHVKNGKATLPDNFYSLYVAYQCSKRGYHIPENSSKDVVQSSIMWKERVTRSTEWNSCSPTCKTESEDVVTETVYIKDNPVEFYYHLPRPLSLGKRFNRNQCHKDCRNKFVMDNPNEITINRQTLTANFNEGDIYMQFYGIDKTEDGEYLIPDTDKGELYTYVEYYLKKRFFEKLLANGDDKNVASLLTFYASEERQQLALAMTDTKFTNFKPSSLKRIKQKNRAEMWKYENMFSILPGEYYTRGYQR